MNEKHLDREALRTAPSVIGASDKSIICPFRSTILFE